MKFVKYVIVLAIALCAIPSASKAQTVMAVGGGSSAIFLEMGQGAASGTYTGTTCVWTSKSDAVNIIARDLRTTPETDESGNIWITWGPGTGSCASPAGSYNIYSYEQLDSVVGNKCYFEVDSSDTPGCVMGLTTAAGTAGANLLPGYTDTNLPAAVISALNGKHFTFAGTDIRPEDAKFQTERLFASCGSPIYRNPYDLGYRLTYGLGYATGTTGVGLQIKSAFSSKLFNVLEFALSGPDPITGNNAPSFTVSPIGAQPIIVQVAPASDTSGIAGASDINGFTLALFYEGVLGRSTDLFGPTTTNPVVTLVREPLSGTYNTFEYSVPNTSQYHTSQDDNFCSGSAVYSQTMNIPSANGMVAGAARKRVIGTGEMQSTLQAASTDTLGYSFWSQANMNGDSNVKYLTVNGVDPLLNSYGDNGTYTPGALPQASPGAGVPPLSAITFKNLAAGDYPAWSAVRVISRPSDSGVANLISASHTLDATQHDYIALSNLKVWHSHFPIYGVTGVYANGSTINTPNDLCNGGAAEAGGDAGGTNVLVQANQDFCSDYGNPSGLINKTN